MTIFYDVIFLMISSIGLTLVTKLGYNIYINSEIYSQKFLIKQLNKPIISDSLSIISFKYRNPADVISILEHNHNHNLINIKPLNTVYLTAPSLDFEKNMIYLIRLFESSTSKELCTVITNIMASLILENIRYLWLRPEFKKIFLSRLNVIDLPWLPDYIKLLDLIIPNVE